MTNERKKYSYSILRYFHDISTGEFINVGVSVFNHEDKKFAIKLKTTTSRISDTFPDIDATAFKALMKSLKIRYESAVKEHSYSIDLGNKCTNLNELLKSVTPFDDSALKWSESFEGVTSDFEKTSVHLFTRYVTKYEPKKNKVKRTDIDLWRSFKKDLDNRKILGFFDEKIISTESDEVKFPFAWKNGIWHCIEPLSFDLSAAESMRDKAHKCLGEMTSINNEAESFKLYLLLSTPSEKKLDAAFDKALSILEKIPVEKEIYFETEKEALIDKLANEIKHHNSTICV
jgi:hypothetical protein